MSAVEAAKARYEEALAALRAAQTDAECYVAAGALVGAAEWLKHAQAIETAKSQPREFDVLIDSEWPTKVRAESKRDVLERLLSQAKGHGHNETYEVTDPVDKSRLVATIYYLFDRAEFQERG